MDNIVPLHKTCHAWVTYAKNPVPLITLRRSKKSK
jgi:hypothetical protein